MPLIKAVMEGLIKCGRWLDGSYVSGGLGADVAEDNGGGSSSINKL